MLNRRRLKINVLVLVVVMNAIDVVDSQSWRNPSAVPNQFNNFVNMSAYPVYTSNNDPVQVYSYNVPLDQQPFQPQQQQFPQQSQFRPEDRYQPQQQFQPQPQEDSFNFRQQVNFATNGCDDYWSFARDASGTIIGVITIQTPDRRLNELKLSLSLAAKLPSDDAGRIDLSKDKDVVAGEISRGSPLIYQVRLPVQNPLPKVTAITLNNQLLCSGQPESANYVTNINLHHQFTLQTSGPNPGFVPNTPRPQARVTTTTPWTAPPTSWNRFTTTTSRPRPPIRPATTPAPPAATTFYKIENFECGISRYERPPGQGLVVGGQFANAGEFPWLAAYFHNGRDKRGFICGGSLISTRLVITAAHCVHNKGSSRPNKAEEATFYLGKYHINKISETHDWMLGVERFEIHEDWDSNDLSYDADIAIAILRQTITFTAYIKAICLWTSTTSYEDLVSKTGIVAGWGRTEDSADASDRPKFSKVPVVSSDRCLRSDSAFGKLTSDRTFCGGSRTNEGPCNGDSGGGLIIKDQDKWYLRGVVSASLVGEHGCDVKNYAIFTDVQWYVRWIQGYITDYN